MPNYYHTIAKVLQSAFYYYSMSLWGNTHSGGVFLTKKILIN